MEKKIFFGVFFGSLLAVAAAIFLPGGRTPGDAPLLPWDIQVDARGNNRVLGVVLGETTLAEAEQRYRDSATVNLFLSPDGEYSAEAYFQRLFLSGIKADLVLALDLPPDLAREMYERGLRVSQLASGNQKIDLRERDLERIAGMPITHITYLPALDLDSELLEQRFGVPAERYREAESDTVHWLYPESGLDIALNPQGREVLQYVQPQEFQRLRAPLDNAAASERSGGPATD